MTVQTLWTADPRVPAILANIRLNPPKIRHFKVPSISSLKGRDDAWEYVGDDVAALKSIANEYFLKAENEGGEDAAREFCQKAPSTDDVIEAALAERVAA